MRLHATHNTMEIKRKDESVKVAAGKKKYSVPFKRKVVQEYLVGLKTPTAIFEEYGGQAVQPHEGDLLAPRPTQAPQPGKGCRGGRPQRKIIQQITSNLF